MRLSLKATYGILAAVHLALHNGVSPVPAKAIAQKQAIPARFLEQVLNALKRAGLVESQRGAQGGYALRKKPADLSLAEIVEALDGPIGRVSAHWPGARSNGEGKQRESVLAHVVDRLREAELKVLSEVSLGELADRQREIEQEQVLMYHI